MKAAVAIADALDKAHGLGVTHRDLKPSNVMLSKSGTKLLDFGLAKLKAPARPVSTSALPTDAELTAHGTIVGTMQYMAPEQLEGIEADARTDIFAFGAVVYEMVTGRKAFQGKSQATLISAIVSAEPEPLSKAQPMAPPALDYVVKRCLAKDPEQRFQTASDLLGQLQWIAEGGTQIGIPAPVPAGRRKRSRLAKTALAIAALLVIAMAPPTLLYLRGPGQGQEVRFLVSVSDMPAPEAIAVSPDGRWIAFAARDTGSASALFVRSIGSNIFTRSTTRTSIRRSGRVRKTPTIVDSKPAALAFLQTFGEQMPLPEPPDLIRYWEYLYERSIGCVGILKDWLVKGLSVAIRQSAPTLTLQHLEKHALSVAQCDRLIEEAGRGESQFREDTDGLSRLRLRLGLSEPARPTEPTAADAADGLRQRHPGERYPKRDAVGREQSRASCPTQ